MEDMKNVTIETVKNDDPKPGTKAYLEAENAALNAQMEAMKAELEAMKEQKPTDAVEVPAGPKMVKVRLPRQKENNEDVFVSVNNYTCIVKRGVEVEVPDFVAEVLQHQEEALEAIMLFEQAHAK